MLLSSAPTLATESSHYAPPPYVQPLRSSPIRLSPTLLPHTPTTQPVSYSLTTPDEYGVNHAVLTFDTPNDARTYLLDLLAHTDDERLENAIQAELDDLETLNDSSDDPDRPSRAF